MVDFKINELYYVQLGPADLHIFKYISESDKFEDDLGGIALFLFSTIEKANRVGESDYFASGSAFGKNSKPVIEHPDRHKLIRIILK